MPDVFIAGLFHLRIVARIVVTIRQAEPALGGLRDYLTRVLKVLGSAEAKDSGNPMGVKARDLVFQTEQVADLIDALKFRLEWCDAFRFNLRLIHA